MGKKKRRERKAKPARPPARPAAKSGRSKTVSTKRGPNPPEETKRKPDKKRATKKATKKSGRGDPPLREPKSSVPKRMTSSQRKRIKSGEAVLKAMLDSASDPDMSTGHRKRARASAKKARERLERRKKKFEGK